MKRSLLLIGTHGTESQLTRMGIARIAVGLAGVDPGLGAKIFGAPPEQVTPAARLLARFFTIRNIALGAWVLRIRDAGAEDQRRCAQVNLAVDAADLVVTLPSIFTKDLRRTAIMSSFLAAQATLAWVQVLQDI